MWKRFAAVLVFLGVAFSTMYLRVFVIGQHEDYKAAASRQGSYTISVAKTYASILDFRLNPLNNRGEALVAVVNPTPENVRDVLPFIVNEKDFFEQIKSGLPFTCAVSSLEIGEGVPTFALPIRTSAGQLAPHILGYTIDDKGVTGIEYAFDSFLRANASKTAVTFETDGRGQPLGGLKQSIANDPPNKAGVVTTLDGRIQAICEAAARKCGLEKGAIVVMEPHTGELKAVVSAPSFDVLDIAKSLDDSDAPFINRAFSAYNVGSVFKLVTAATALQQGTATDFSYVCTGSIDVYGQHFRCHKLDGHGVLDMQGAMVESCNTYFINLAEQLKAGGFLTQAANLGFGMPSKLADGITSARGNLQTIEQLYNPAEKANLAFGQGMLTATPLQIAAMTAAIVNNGKFSEPRLILGTTLDGKNITETEKNGTTAAIPAEVAVQLRRFMEATVNDNQTSAGRPYNTTAGGKTSTAQTGRFDENGKEKVEAWFTGYFPMDKPQYVVTVLVEDGVGGNASAAPIFKEVAQEVTKMLRMAAIAPN